MTELLKRAIAAIKALPPDRQDFAAAVLLQLARAAPREYALTPEQIADVKASIEEADRALFATDEEVEEAWRHFVR